jgi:hypothetical protein
MIADGMLCLALPRAARWVVVARLESGAFYTMDYVEFIWHRNAVNWIRYESRALGQGRYEPRRIRA